MKTFQALLFCAVLFFGVNASAFSPPPDDAENVWRPDFGRIVFILYGDDYKSDACATTLFVPLELMSDGDRIAAKVCGLLGHSETHFNAFDVERGSPRENARSFLNLEMLDDKNDNGGRSGLRCFWAGLGFSCFF